MNGGDWVLKTNKAKEKEKPVGSGVCTRRESRIHNEFLVLPGMVKN